MVFQPYEASISTSDVNEFDNLEGIITSFGYSQADNNVLYFPPDNGSSSPSTESLALNGPNEIWNENYGSIEISSFEQSSEFDEPLFPDVNLGEAFLTDTFEDPINEVTVTTTIPTDTENDNSSTTADNSPAELNLIPGAAEATAEIIFGRTNLKSVDSSTQQRLLSVIRHPTINPRRRYKSEGRRRIKKLSDNSMTLDLSQLRGYQVLSYQLLWLRLTLITYSDNPSDKIYVHSDELKYVSDDSQVEIDGSVCIRITQSDIDRGKIELKDLEIIKKLDKMYSFKLIPYSISTIDNKSEPYTKDETKTICGNAKVFRKKYNLKASRIACQILIEEEGTYHFTHITCVTNVMIEQKYEPKGTKANKRLIKNNRKSGKKRRNAKKSKSTKRKTRSNN